MQKLNFIINNLSRLNNKVCTTSFNKENLDSVVASFF